METKTAAVFCTAAFLFTTAQAVPRGGENLVEITASLQEPVPDWAVTERRFFNDISDIAINSYSILMDRNDRAKTLGPWDDLYEFIINYAILYAAGGKDTLLELAQRGYDGMTEQFGEANPGLMDEYRNHFDWYQMNDPQFVDDFPQYDDWFHYGEGMQIFYDLGLAAPDNEQNIERARRFADFYTGDDPDVQNYDPENNIIRSYLNGSKGPSFEVRESALEYLLNPNDRHSSFAPLADQPQPGFSGNPQQLAEVKQLYEELIMRGDVGVNLYATAMVANAYLYTGEEKYREWCETYVGGWIDRVEQAGGILSDNTDETGVPGGNRNGQFWGGFFGWTGLWTIQMLHGACVTAAEAAYLVGGSQDCLELSRSQTDWQFEHASGGSVPHRCDRQGWYQNGPIWVEIPSHNWSMSMADEDWQRIVRLRNLGGNWNGVSQVRDRAADQDNERPRIQYYDGRNGGWPNQILQADYNEIQGKWSGLQGLRGDAIYSFPGYQLWERSPIQGKAIVQVTMGGPQRIYYGSLVQGRVRYYDADRLRPGLPWDVAALVEGLEAERTVVYLVNTGSGQTRNLILQAGLYGEHSFTTVSYDGGQRSEEINHPWFKVSLPPGTHVRLDIGTELYVNKPSYLFPWHEVPTGTVMRRKPALPAALKISRVSLNKSSRALGVDFTVPPGGAGQALVLSLFDAKGRNIVTHVVNASPQGRRTETVPLNNAPVPAGAFIIRLTCGNMIDVRTVASVE